jgi:hypothetical protein
MILTHKTIGTPAPKTEIIDIPGGDGVLDMTEFFGEVKYGNRPIAYEFSTAIPHEQFPAFFSRVANALHGQKVEIVDDEDPDCYYIGRLTVSEFQAKRAIGTLTIDCDCEPYKYHLASQTVHLCGRNMINLDAGTMTTQEWTKTATGYTFTRSTSTAGSFVHWSIPVRKGQTYAFSAGYSLTTRLLYVYTDRLLGNLAGKAEAGKPVIFTAEENGVYIFAIYVTSAATDGTFSNIILEEGGSVGTYVAYDKTARTVEATFSNVRKTAIPVAYANSAVSVESPSNYMALISGKNALDSFPFYKGDTTLTFKGNGTVVVEWLERGL